MTEPVEVLFVVGTQRGRGAGAKNHILGGHPNLIGEVAMWGAMWPHASIIVASFCMDYRPINVLPFTGECVGKATEGFSQERRVG